MLCLNTNTSKNNAFNARACKIHTDVYGSNNNNTFKFNLMMCFIHIRYTVSVSNRVNNFAWREQTWQRPSHVTDQDQDLYKDV